MNLKHEIEQCLADRNWTPHKLAKEAGLASDMGIRRILSGEREGLHSKNLCKLLPFFASPAIGHPLPSSSQPHPDEAA